MVVGRFPMAAFGRFPMPSEHFREVPDALGGIFGRFPMRSWAFSGGSRCARGHFREVPDRLIGEARGGFLVIMGLASPVIRQHHHSPRSSTAPPARSLTHSLTAVPARSGNREDIEAGHGRVMMLAGNDVDDVGRGRFLRFLSVFLGNDRSNFDKQNDFSVLRARKNGGQNVS